MARTAAHTGGSASGLSATLKLPVWSSKNGLNFGWGARVSFAAGTAFADEDGDAHGAAAFAARTSTVIAAGKRPFANRGARRGLVPAGARRFGIRGGAGGVARRRSRRKRRRSN
jgi:hypothetical protein